MPAENNVKLCYEVSDGGHQTQTEFDYFESAADAARSTQRLAQSWSELGWMLLNSRVENLEDDEVVVKRSL